jgi:hypothetical protein
LVHHLEPCREVTSRLAGLRRRFDVATGLWGLAPIT